MFVFQRFVGTSCSDVILACFSASEYSVTYRIGSKCLFLNRNLQPSWSKKQKNEMPVGEWPFRSPVSHLALYTVHYWVYIAQERVKRWDLSILGLYLERRKLYVRSSTAQSDDRPGHGTGGFDTFSEDCTVYCAPGVSVTMRSSSRLRNQLVGS